MTEFTLKKKKIEWRKLCAFFMAVCVMLTSLNLSGAVVFAASKNTGAKQGKEATPLSSDEEELTSDEERLTVHVVSASSITAKIGGKAEFCLSAKSPFGDEKITYEWYKGSVKDSNRIEGNASGKLVFKDVKKEDFATYYCVVTDENNKITKKFSLSQKNTLTVHTDSWNGVYVTLGGNTKLQVSAETTGNEVIKYSWSKRADDTEKYAAITSATTDTLTLHNITSASYGAYQCTISCGTETKKVDFDVYEAIDLSVNDQISLEVKRGQTLTLDTNAYTASGSSITYQWIKRNGDVQEELKGETNSTYTIASVMEGDETIYSCKVTAGTETKVVNFSLYIQEPNFAYADRVSQYRKPGEDATLAVIPYDEKEYTYQWYKWDYQWESEDEWKKIEGAVSTSYTISNSTGNDFGQYRCVVSKGKEMQCITMYLYEEWETSSLHLEYRENYYLSPGETDVLRVKVRGVNDNQNLRYRWYKTDLNEYEYELIDGENGEECEVTFPTREDGTTSQDDSLRYRCEVTNTETNETETAYFSVNHKKTLTIMNRYSESRYYSIVLGNSVTLKAVAETTTNNPITYQWYKGSEKIDGATEENYLLEIKSTDDFSSYTCQVSDGCNTERIDFEVWQKNTLYYYVPCNTFYKLLGDSVTMEVVASGNNMDRVQYQWMVRSVNDSWTVIKGATNATYTINSLKQKDLNQEYRCRITNGQTEGNCWFYVNDAAEQTEDHLSAYIKGTNYSTSKSYTAYAGQKFSIDIEAYSNLGEEAISYQWEKYNEDMDKYERLTGENKKQLSFQPYTSQQQGRYRCKVTAGIKEIDIKVNISTISMLSFEEEDKEYSAYYNEAVTLEARAKSDNPEAKEITYQWYAYDYEADKKVKLENETAAKLTIEHLKDGGRYYCEAFDGFEYAEMSVYVYCETHLRVKDNEDIIAYQGDNIEIKTDVTYKGQAVECSSYQWYYYDSEEEDAKRVKITENGNGSTLAIKNMQQTSPKSYVCEVTYQGEKATAYYYVSFYKDLKVTTKKSYFYIELGAPVSLNVTATSNTGKEIAYQWYAQTCKGKWNKIEGATSATYSKASVTDADYGYYKCIVSTDQETKEITFNLYDDDGEQYKDVSLEVSGDGNEYKQCFLGNRVVLEANARSNKVIHYKWYKYDHKKQTYIALENQTRSQLILDQITEEQFGDYLCEVTAASKTRSVSYNISKATDAYLCEQRYEEIIAEVGKNKTLQAMVTSDQLISYEWYKWNERYEAYEELDCTGNQYRLTNINKENSGRYVCQFTVGDQTDTITYQVDCFSDISFSSELPQSKHDYSDDLDQYFGYYNEAYKEATQLAVTFDEKTAFENGYDYIQIFDANSDAKRYSSEELAGKTIYVDGNKFILRFKTDGSVTDWGFAVTNVMPIEKPVSTEKPVTDIELDKETIKLALNQSEILTPSFAPFDATNQKVAWETKDPSVATVDGNGKVTAVGVGTTTVIAKSEDGNYESECSVTVFAYVSSVTLNKTVLTLEQGKAETLYASIMPANAENKDVIWSSSNNTIVTVDEAGKVTAIKPGTATITVTTKDGNKTATCKVTVNLSATKVQLSKTSLTLTKGASSVLGATITPSNSTDRITWSTSNKNVATVDQSGKVVAVNPGTAVITAKSTSGKQATCTVTVNQIVNKPVNKPVVKPVVANSIKLNKAKATINVKASVTLKATINPTNAVGKVTWSTSNKKIATVSSNGVVKGVKAGTVTITAQTSNGKKATCKVTVKQPAQKVVLNKKTANLKKGKTLQLKAKITPSNSTDKLVWSTSNKKLATVSKSGKVKALKKGTVTITVKTSSGKKATCKIKVK